MRLPSLLLSVLVVPTVVVVAPVATPPGPPAPRPVEPTVVEQPLAVPDALAEAPGHRTVVLEAPRETEPFSTVGVTWEPGPAPADVVVRLRTRGDDGWGDWTPLESEDADVAPDAEAAAPGTRDGAGPAWVGPSDAVQVRVDVLRGPAPEGLELVLVDPGSSPADAAAGSASTVPASTAHADGAPVIRSRAAWGADESIRGGAPSYSRTLEAVTVHHTAGRSDYAQEEVPAVLRGIYAFHVQSRGWSDVGYNVLVDRFGTAWEGRAGGLDRPVIGAHAGGFNTSTAGISMIGTFEDVVPSPEVVTTVAEVAAWKLGLYGRDPGSTAELTSAGSTSKFAAGSRVTLPRIFGHRDTGNTSCPGTGGYSVLPEIRRQAAEIAATASPRVQPFGSYDGVVGGDEQYLVHGWVVDPDASRPGDVVPLLDGVPQPPVPLDQARTDVVAAYPPYPLVSGFAAWLPAPPGEHEVCLIARNQQGGEDLGLGCRTVQVQERPAPPSPRTTDDACPPGGTVLAFRDTSASVHRDAIGCAVRWEVARGRGDGTFGAADPVTRGHMALFLARTVLRSGGSLPATPARAFDDLGAVTSEVRLAVEQLAAVGVLRGRAARTYDPLATVTRGQMATFLAGSYAYRTGRPLPEGRDYFTDDDDSVHEAAIGRVAAAGITGGTGGTQFSPLRPTERGQTASFLTRVLDLLVEEGTSPGL